MDERRLGERYELGEVIGRGGMAEVYEGRDLRLGRRVAVKLLRTDLARDPSFVARFRREAHSAASLNHPNIVAVYDTGETDVSGVAVPYIVMEHVDGTTLRELVKSGHRFTPERAVEITEGTLTALDYSHRHGIIHRDIKPGNVMLSRTGQVKVMDFGIARAVADSAATMTQTSAGLGTAQYLSPEQARGEVVDARSDLYSTGCLLYELLAGRPPFVGDSPVSVAYQHVRETPAPPSTLNPDVGPAVDSVVMRALEKRPDDRYDTAAAMRDDLERARLGEPLAGAGAVAAAAAVPAAVLAAGAGNDATQVIAPVLPGTGTASAGSALSDPSRAGWYVLLSAAVVGALVLAFFLGRSIFGGTDANIAVPNVVGLKQVDAVAQIQDRGLKLGAVTPVTSDTVPLGYVVSQDPVKDTKVAANTAVDLTVSSGAEQVTVPTLVGLTQSQALDALAAAGLVPGTITLQDKVDQPAGTVIAVDPKEGTSVAKGSTVALTVSSGKVPVPSVIGELQEQAKADLANAGFSVTVIPQTTSSVPAGTVIAQNPKSGTLLAQGKIVTITVAQAPPSPTPTPTPTPTGTSSPSP
ncbi:MAG: Stk1 family PASTA domain-containing Ser/Thr kinase [Actinomycetes bacterium]